MVEPSRRELFRYVVRPIPDGAPEHFEEIRTDPNNELDVKVPPRSDFVIVGNFFRLLRYLLPEARDHSRFRYLGRWTGPGQDYLIVAFAQRPDGADLQSHIQVGGRGTALLQGVVWIDSATNRVVRLRLDLLGHIEDSPFNTLTTDISLVPMNLPSIGPEFLVPARVTVHVRYGEGDVHSVHRYSDYRLSGVAAENHANIPTMEAASVEDPWELLDRGVSLARENKPGEAIAVLHEALRLNPDMSVGQYHLAAILRASGDLTGAEDAVREALKHAPNSGPAHNLLGILLFRRGDTQGAVTEFRTERAAPTERRSGAFQSRPGARKTRGSERSTRRVQNCRHSGSQQCGIQGKVRTAGERIKHSLNAACRNDHHSQSSTSAGSGHRHRQGRASCDGSDTSGLQCV